MTSTAWPMGWLLSPTWSVGIPYNVGIMMMSLVSLYILFRSLYLAFINVGGEGWSSGRSSIFSPLSKGDNPFFAKSVTRAVCLYANTRLNFWGWQYIVNILLNYEHIYYMYVYSCVFVDIVDTKPVPTPPYLGDIVCKSVCLCISRRRKATKLSCPPIITNYCPSHIGLPISR